jgi:ATP-dependent Clp endopeptidase proteolytic subunit ClpP
MTDSAPRDEAAKSRDEAEARKLTAEAREAEANARVAELKLQAAEEGEQARLADDDHRRVLRFVGAVQETTVKPSIDRLVRWHRLEPKCDITIIFDSPGGGIIEGFALFDQIIWLRNNGHKVTTIGQGMAASMAGVLLQAGDVRIMSPQASLLIHEASFMTGGSFGQVEDQVKFVKKLQERILDIFADRSKLSKTQIRKRWTRTNWWLDANEALELGFVDDVR